MVSSFRHRRAGALLALLLAGCTPLPDRPRLSGEGVGFALPPVIEVLAAAPVGTTGQPPASGQAGGTSPGSNLPVDAPSPPAPGSGGSGGGAASGGGAPAGPGAGTGFRGTVVGVTGGREVPLAGATVLTTDGQVVTTGADGAFTLAGDLPADGALSASQPGYVASAVFGLTGDAPVTLHLQAVTGTDDVPPPSLATRMRAVGRVVAPDGSPLPNMLVVLEDDQGAISAPALTEADGDFELMVFSPKRAVENGTVLAAGLGAQPHVAIATGVRLTPDNPDLDLDSAPGIGPLRAVATTLTVRVAVAAGPIGGTVRQALDLVGPGGASLGLPLNAGVAHVAELPGVRYVARAEVINPSLGTRSEFRRDPVVLAGTPETLVSGTLLAPPVMIGDTPLRPGERFMWQPVSGALGYQGSVAGLDAEGFLWEAFTQATSMVFTRPDPLPSGNYGFTLTAWDQGELAPRSVAAVGPARLKLLPTTGSFRRSSVQVRRSL
jgi:hypothetical protein